MRDEKGDEKQMLTGCSTVVLWVSQNIEDEYAYNLAL
jgi:hypothetical protein